MTLKQLASEVANREGKASQVSIGNIREILGIVSEFIAMDEKTVAELRENGQRRLRRASARKALVRAKK